MKLFYSKGACSLVVRIVLNELNMDFEEEEVDLRSKKTAKGTDFLTINPKGAVPALMLDSQQVLTENQVILQYLADNSPGQTLLAPIQTLGRYQTLELLNYISTELHKSIGLFFNPKFPESEKTNLLLPTILMKFGFLDACLSKTPYLSGKEFTLPDAYLYVMLRWADHFKMDLSQYTHLGQFKARLETYPSVITSLRQEGLYP
ncbi:MAG: glutathione transferase GstA [Legionella sp.]|nr:glutathione transferase GstA [Legionella sp.]